MHTTYGEHLLKPYFEKKNIVYEEMLETCLLVLSWERFHLDPQKRSDLIKASAITQTLMQRIIRDLPREEKEKTDKSAGSRGWKIAKKHAGLFIPIFNTKYGRAKCSDSSSNENNHRAFVKHNAKLTQRISSKFATQLAANDYDRVVIEKVYDYIRPLCSKNHNATTSEAVAASQAAQPDCLYDSDEEEDVEGDETSDDELGIVGTASQQKTISVNGKYTMSIDIGERNCISVSSQWKWNAMQMIGVSPNHFVHKTIADASIKYTTNRDLDNAASLNVIGYTSAVIDRYRYRSTPYWKGQEWYDWASVKFPKTVNSQGGDTSICRIMGFFQYNTEGCMTFSNQELVSTSPDELTGCLDETLYAVLHCQTSYFSYSRLQQKFIRKFRMMDPNEMYILPARCIRGPVIVVPDIEGEDMVSLRDYMAVLPRHRMGGYFLHHMNSTTNDENDSSADEEEEDEMYGDSW